MGTSTYLYISEWFWWGNLQLYKFSTYLLFLWRRKGQKEIEPFKKR